MANVPVPSNDFLTIGYVAMSVPGHAFTLFNIYIQTTDCRQMRMHFCPRDQSYRYVTANGKLTDRAVCYRPNIRRGTVVPQTIWQPAQAGDVQRHVAGLLWPIFFVRANDVLGATVAQVSTANSAPSDLLDFGNIAPLGGLSTTTLCLKWPGYPEHKKQVETRNTTGFITVAKLLERIAKFMEKFIQDARNHRNDTNWRVGPGGMINEHNIRIVGLMHVSRGVWQPILQLDGLTFT
ncbi:unnamed protein product [Peniophora sp. CBMAI 1063]|nr:unnamed protein product [Peniophora sp. CBMAI 1063]